MAENAGGSSFIRVNRSVEYVGFSTWDKPLRGRQVDSSTTTASDLPVGSVLKELDTGKEFVFDGTDWVLMPRDKVLDRLDELKTILTLKNGVLEEILLTLQS